MAHGLGISLFIPSLVGLVSLGLEASSFEVQAAPVVDTFELQNTNLTPANDLTVRFNNSITVIGTNTIANTASSFRRVTSASPFSQLMYDMPPAGVTVNQNASVKVTVQADRVGATGLRIDTRPAETFFTMGGVRIQNSAKLVSADVDLNVMPGTAVVVISNPTSDEFQFLTDIKIWTNLSLIEALNDALSLSMPSTPPNLTPGSIALSPGSVGTISLSALPPSASSALMFYDFAFGPSASPSGAEPQGIFAFAAPIAATPAPEPSSLIIIGTGLLGLALTCRRRYPPLDCIWS